MGDKAGTMTSFSGLLPFSDDGGGVLYLEVVSVSGVIDVDVSTVLAAANDDVDGSCDAPSALSCAGVAIETNDNNENDGMLRTEGDVNLSISDSYFHRGSLSRFNSCQSIQEASGHEAGKQICGVK